MGGEFGQRREWAHEDSLDWHLLQFSGHQGVQSWLKHLHILYKGEPALHELDCQPAGFEWVDCTGWEKSIINFLRKGKTPGDSILVISNFTPVTRYNYREGDSRGGYWREMLNSDAGEYGGSGQGNLGGVEATTVPCHGREHSIFEEREHH